MQVQTRKIKGILNIEEKCIDLIKLLSYALGRNVRLKPVILVRYFRYDTNEGFINSQVPNCFICMRAHHSSWIWFCSCSPCKYLGFGHRREKPKPVSLIAWGFLIAIHYLQDLFDDHSFCCFLKTQFKTSFILWYVLRARTCSYLQCRYEELGTGKVVC